MKNRLIFILQRLLGYERYLYLFANIKIRLLKFSSKKKTYFHFEQLIDEDATIAVVGASIGITTIPLINDKRTIFAYEPIRSNTEVIERLKRKFKADRLIIFTLALGNARGTREIVFPRIKGARKHGLSYLKGIDIDAQPDGELMSVEMDRLDAREELQNSTINAMKVVAENYEFEIFSGAANIIERDAPIIYCELWDNTKRPKVLNLIRSMNYTVFVLVDGTLKPYNDQLESYRGKHFIFRPNE